MKELILRIIEPPLGVALALLPLSILAKNLIGAGHSIQENAFNLNYLKRGLFKGILIYLGIGIISLMSLLSNELFVVINDVTYTLVNGVTVIIMGAVMVYIIDTFKILQLVWRTSTTVTIESDRVKSQKDRTFCLQEEKK
ncbi:hypothetical protein G7062_06500 [Erysipelothrix sp. HDW6C]|uniref:hypothetical protein n=1 Tax=Erysipelothrix sp. HDW6C TaxID=2714930 RepID=UPI00140CDA90|nr:hypothetical protein [Erysipelothrix sp. HDW6C]QIK69958.1 hypothetical protein G7062_06500 [Erysipelothrix sp. HDW6C]